MRMDYRADERRLYIMGGEVNHRGHDTLVYYAVNWKDQASRQKGRHGTSWTTIISHLEILFAVSWSKILRLGASGRLRRSRHALQLMAGYSVILTSLLHKAAPQRFVA